MGQARYRRCRGEVLRDGDAKSTGAKKTVIVSSATLSKKITGLKKSASYTIRVYAKNATGNGVYSSVSNTITAR